MEEQCEIDNTKFGVDLRIPGFPDDAVQQDENYMKEINENLEKLRIGSNVESIKQDLSREDGNLTFSEDPRRIISQMGKVKLIELGITKATVQCQVCYRHVLEGIIFCQCGYCLRPDEDIEEKV